MSDIGITIKRTRIHRNLDVSCERWMDRNRDLYLLKVEAGRQSITIFMPVSEISRILETFDNPVITRPPSPVTDTDTDTEHHQ